MLFSHILNKKDVTCAKNWVLCTQGGAQNNMANWFNVKKISHGFIGDIEKSVKM